MATIFFSDAREVIFIDYLKNEKAIGGKYYAHLLHLLNDEIKKKLHI